MGTRMYEIQQKVFSLIDSNSEIKKLTRGIYDYVPEKTKTPYITFGPIISDSDDTKTSDGEIVTVTLDIWSESKGRKETVTIINTIENILEQNEVDLDTAILISQKVVHREVEEENYGLYHGVIDIQFRIVWD
ncbi:tail protein [Geobacillus phage GR1]|nr:tail protein [Geobacillus phage GR1]